ncbi:MAG: hypothetical protein Q8R07_03940 [Candidatus Uhrbacteria bacterium]|nr:hypothetical protein [Candidatus Uhrbacteria bacterium]
MLIHRKPTATQAQAFKRLFGAPLWDYWNVFTGFDSIRLSDTLAVPDDESMSMYIERKYGTLAVKLIEELIS